MHFLPASVVCEAQQHVTLELQAVVENHEYLEARKGAKKQT